MYIIIRKLFFAFLAGSRTILDADVVLVPARHSGRPGLPLLRPSYSEPSSPQNILFPPPHPSRSLVASRRDETALEGVLQAARGGQACTE